MSDTEYKMIEKLYTKCVPSECEFGRTVYIISDDFCIFHIAITKEDTHHGKVFCSKEDTYKICSDMKAVSIDGRYEGFSIYRELNEGDDFAELRITTYMLPADLIQKGDFIPYSCGTSYDIIDIHTGDKVCTLQRITSIEHTQYFRIRLNTYIEYEMDDLVYIYTITKIGG
jgi:hypothetical protein